MSKPEKIISPDAAAMADRLRALRTTTGLSQERFAAKVGLGYRQWANFEVGSRIGLDAALVLVREMHVTLDWIYRGDARLLPHVLAIEIDRHIRDAETA